jgi:threonyl-tRNA synthetase
MKAPYTLVVGDKEQAGGPLAIRIRGQKDMVEMSLADFTAKLLKDIKERASTPA